MNLSDILAGVGTVTGLFALFVVVLWLAVGFSAGWLAYEKGRSETAWALLGLVFGPLAVLVVGLAPRGMSGMFGGCPRCGEAIRRVAVQCPYCGTHFASEPDDLD